MKSNVSFARSSNGEDQLDPCSLQLRTTLEDPVNARASKAEPVAFFVFDGGTEPTWISFSAKYQKYRCLSVSEIKSTFIVLVVGVEVSLFRECRQRRISLSFICRLVPNSIDLMPKPIDDSNDDDAGRTYA